MNFYVRQICHLWELAHGAALEGLPAATGPYTPLFDPEKFITGPPTRDIRWRVDFGCGCHAGRVGIKTPRSKPEWTEAEVG